VTTTTNDRPARPEAIRAVPVRHPGRWVAVAVLAVLAAMLVHAFVTNKRFEWATVWHYLFDPRILQGVRATLILTFVAMIIGIVLGVILSVMRLSQNPILSSVAWLYIWLFRGTPVLVQLLFWNFLGYLYHSLSLGVPFGPAFVTGQTNVLVVTWTAALLGLGLNEAAYMAEIVRGGIISVDEGQLEAASALGLSRTITLRRIVLPQALRVIIPPIGNETISMLKTTSLVSVISLAELLTSAQRIYENNFKTVPLLIVASIWYLFLTSILTVIQYYIERHYARGASRNLPLTPLQKLRRRVAIGANR
jgi:polar amino acid transport system permease protein